MKYRKDKNNNEISILGYGCMRFTKKKDGKIDLDKAEKEIITAYIGGVNYFDTAYTYPGNEVALGEILSRTGIRKEIHIASKLPHYLIKKPESAEKYFCEELRRLRTDYIDYYLMHMLQDVDTWNRLKKLGIEEWINEKKSVGEIGAIGFSYHGNSDMFCKLIDCYDWDFCQIQYNYLDENSQAGKTGLKYAASKGITVIIMEPLRGGKLTNGLPQKAKELIKESNTTPAKLGLKWLWNQPEVTCVLSGMNSIEMIEENINCANSAEIGGISTDMIHLIEEVKAIINDSIAVGCTGCRYCMPCPHGVDIPGTFAAYNRLQSDGWHSAFKEYALCTLLRKNPTPASNCKGCGRCVSRCPQGIDIPAKLKKATGKLEGPLYNLGKRFLPLFMKY